MEPMVGRDQGPRSGSGTPTENTPHLRSSGPSTSVQNCGPPDRKYSAGQGRNDVAPTPLVGELSGVGDHSLARRAAMVGVWSTSADQRQSIGERLDVG
jgi:hypothetical protein